MRNRPHRALTGVALGLLGILLIAGPASAQTATPTETATPLPTSTPTATAVATICTYGMPYEAGGLPKGAQAKVTNGVIPSAGSMTLIPAPGVGLRTYLTGLHYSAAGATIVTVASGGRTIDTANIAANQLVVDSPAAAQAPLCTPANAVVTASQSGSVSTFVSATYVVAP